MKSPVCRRILYVIGGLLLLWMVRSLHSMPSSWSRPARAAWESPWAVRSCFWKYHSSRFPYTAVPSKDEVYKLILPKQRDNILLKMKYYFAFNSRSIDFVTIFGIAAFVLAGGYVVIQSIFRISVNDKIQSYGQLRTIGATPNQIRRIVKKESRRLGGIGILSGVLPGVGSGLLLFPKGFHGTYYGMAVILTAVVCWLMVAFSVSRPVKIAASISPMEAVRFSAGQEKIHSSRNLRKR